MGIRAKLVICLLAVLIPLLGASAFALQLFEQQLKRSTENALQNSLRLESLRINDLLTNYTKEARALAEDTLVVDFVSAANDNRSNPDSHVDQQPLQNLTLELQRKASLMGANALEFRLIDKRGNTLGQSSGFTWSPQDPDLVKKSISRVKSLFGDAFIAIDEEHRLGMTTPIINIQGNVVGALALELPMNGISDILSMYQSTGKSHEAYLTQMTAGGDAQLITNLKFDKKSAFNRVIPYTENLPANQSLRAKSSRLIHAYDYRGVETIATIYTIPASQWGFVLKLDSAEAFAPVGKLRKSLGIAAIISLLIILGGYTICLAPIAHRLKKTATAAHKIMKGDLSARVGDYNNDEIGHLARTIDSLALQLEQDQRKRSKIEDQLRHQATHDELTGLLNRKFANKLIDELSVPSNEEHSVMFLDLNGFKDVNDFYGHSVGDEVLSSVAERLIHAIPNNATLARWGGDEFVVILPNTDSVSANVHADTVHEAFTSPVTTSQGTHEITTSIGISTSNPSKSLSEALTEADSLMYLEKKSKKNDRSIKALAARTLERAMSEERVELWYQPILCCNSAGKQELVAAEVKIRIRSTEGGIIPIEELLPELQHEYLTTHLHLRTLSESMQAVSRWKKTNIVSPDFKIHFNIGHHIVGSTEFLQSIERYSADSNQQLGANVVLHIADMHALEETILEQVKMSGLSVATTLNSPVSYPSKEMKQKSPMYIYADIDSLPLDNSTAQWVANCTKHGNTLKVSGISTKDQLATLSGLGVRHFQGNLFDTPLKAVDFVSRWGQPAAAGLIPLSTMNFRLKLAG